MASSYKELKKAVDAEIELLEKIAINDEELSAFERCYQEAKHKNMVNRFGRICYEKAVANGK